MARSDANTPVQLSLGVRLNDEATFANFYTQPPRSDRGSPHNYLVLTALAALVQGEQGQHHTLWGEHGSGLSHLLQALCHHAQHAALHVQYLPLAELSHFPAEQICEGLECCDIVCVDDLHLIAGQMAWEQAIFHLYNRSRDAGHSLVISSHLSPGTLPLALADLKSRILGSLVYQVKALDDEGKYHALIARAKARGLMMSDEVARYILRRSQRHVPALFALLERLDHLSLQQQRKLTIPFVRQTLGI